MIDQQTTIDLAIKAGVIDSADINSINIPQGYIDDLAEFAYLVLEDERAKIVDMLWRIAGILMGADDYRGCDVIQIAIGMIEDLRE